MDINVKVRLESPELMAALLALAESLPQMNIGAVLKKEKGQAVGSKAAAVKGESKNKSKESAKEDVKKDVKKEKGENITLEEVRAAMAEKNREGHREKVKAIILNHGANKLTSLEPKHFSEVLKEVEAIK